MPTPEQLRLDRIAEARNNLGNHRILELPLQGDIVPEYVKAPKTSIDCLDDKMKAWHSMLSIRGTDH